MERKTVRGIYDSGELRFAEPVEIEGCWSLEITFLEEVDDASIPLDADPHRPKRISGGVARLEELHRAMEDQRPTTPPW